MDKTLVDTTIEIDRWPGLKAVGLLIAYDNGMIGRHYTEEEWLNDLGPRLHHVSDFDLGVLDAWCLALSDADRETLASGEFEAMEQVEATCPRPELVTLLDTIFEVV